MESCSEAYVFAGYPKDLRGSFFYSPKDNKVFVRTNTTFLEKDYMKNYKPKNEVIMEEIIGEMSALSAPNVEAPVIDKIYCSNKLQIYEEL